MYYVQIEKGGVYQQKKLDRVKNALVELQSWLFVTDDERETKNRQKLLRNLRVSLQNKCFMLYLLTT